MNHNLRKYLITWHSPGRHLVVKAKSRKTLDRRLSKSERQEVTITELPKDRG